MKIKLKMKIFFLLIFILLSTACTTNKVEKSTKVKEFKKYDLRINEFPHQDLIVNDVNFIGYLDISAFYKNRYLSKFMDILAKKYFVRNSMGFFFTLSDIYKSQEFLIFLTRAQLNSMPSIPSHELKRETVISRELIKKIKVDNYEFGYIKGDGSVFGDISLIHELFDINDKKIKPISDERYKIFSDTSFSKDKVGFKLIFMPNTEYKKLILEFSNKHFILKPLLVGLNYMMLEVEMLKDDRFFLKIILNSKKENINLIYNFVNTQKKLLMTLNATPFSKLNSNKITENMDLLKNLELEKLNENTLVFSLKIEESKIKKYFKLLLNYVNKETK